MASSQQEQESGRDTMNKKDSWGIYYIVDSDPGTEYEILSRCALVKDQWDRLTPGLLVEVNLYKNAKVQAYVVEVSDDYESLKERFTSVTTQYTKDMLGKISFPFRKNERKIKYAPAKLDLLKEEIVRKLARDDDDDDDEDKENKPNNQAVNANKKKRSNPNNHNGDDDKEFQNGEVGKKVPEQNGDVIQTLRDENDRLKLKYNVLMRMYEKVRTTLCSLLNTSDMPYDDLVNTDRENLREVVRKHKRFERANMRDVIVQIGDTIYMGRHKTAIPKVTFESINWLSCSAATRKLLVTIFSKDVLATHSLTGKPSPAFLNSGKNPKRQLDPHKTADIIEVVALKCHVTASTVRNAITTKCADENKMRKKRGAKIQKVAKAAEEKNRNVDDAHKHTGDDNDEPTAEKVGVEAEVNSENNNENPNYNKQIRTREDPKIEVASKKLKV